ncbi:methyltransferase domain-containing protein [Truncatella angustata]|uniref:Methyltransferase domain-containing protein n=1 Tax=Truncatella angustata TaxID=152316 RepID=A0A9P8RM05_9PEZI|nr:methyltransferase domain-containing protein [Truncatella angustata]KAH6645825.1 methyltransferase domain-containing protein [Truncatella angustata]
MNVDDVDHPLPAFQNEDGENIPHGQTIEAAAPVAAGSIAGQNEIISQLEVDSNRSDNDSSLGSEITSTSTSLRSEDYEFRFDHGRRYQSANDKYHLPNDIQEMDRLELQHLIWLELCGGRYNLAPLDTMNTMTHVLDVGCGTGNWAIEFANLHPSVQVVGTDLSPIQPDYVPMNCTFYIDDASHDWSFHQRFDYVHVRALTMGIANWDKFVDQAYRFLQPGGYLELQEFHIPLESPDGSIREGSALWRWGEKINRVCGKLGIDSMGSLKHSERLRNRGFVNVEEKHLRCPLGPWAKGQRQKKLGWMGRKDLYEGIDGISKKLLVMMGEGTEEEVDKFLEECKADLMDPAIHPCMPLDVIWGQRPLDS